jgi:hypothetical protein
MEKFAYVKVERLYAYWIIVFYPLVCPAGAKLHFTGKVPGV